MSASFLRHSGSMCVLHLIQAKSCTEDRRPILRWQCRAEAGQHTEDLEQQLALMKQELAGLEHSASDLQAEAERREAQLLEQCARADAAERECAQLAERLAASNAGLSAYQATCAKQVRPSCDCAIKQSPHCWLLLIFHDPFNDVIRRGGKGPQGHG